MSKFFSGLIFFALLAGAAFYYFYFEKPTLFKGTINFSVLEFTNGGLIPQKFTCEGSDVHPTFSLERVPSDARSLVFIVDEPNAGPAPFTHYLLFNVDPNTGMIDQGVSPFGSVSGTNDFGKQEYNGPCPAFGIHKYNFAVYALSKELLLDESATRTDVDNAMKGSIIAKGEFSGEYTKN